MVVERDRRDAAAAGDLLDIDFENAAASPEKVAFAVDLSAMLRRMLSSLWYKLIKRHLAETINEKRFRLRYGV